MTDTNRFQVKRAPEDETVYIMDHRAALGCALILTDEQAVKLRDELLALYPPQQRGGGSNG